MKIVKYIFLLILLAGIAITVFIATQDGKYDIQKERIIKVPKTVLYNYINDLKNWQVTAIMNSDSTAVYTFSENTSDKGAFVNWDSKENDIKITTVNTVAPDSIIQNAVINNMHSDITWAFKDTLQSTKVTLRLKGQLTFTEKAYAIINGGVSERIESELENSLASINTFLVDEVNDYSIDVQGEASRQGVFYLGQAVTVPTAETNRKINEILPKLYSFASDNKITINGAPFVMYKNMQAQKDSASFKVCIPIRDEIYTSPESEFEGGNIITYPAVKTTLRGDYSHLPKARKASVQYIREKELTENTTGNYTEVYTRGVKDSKRPSQWITDIYTPIGHPADTIAAPPPVRISQPQPVRQAAPTPAPVQ